MGRRVAALLGMAAIAPLLAGALGGCGAGTGQLQVSVTGDSRHSAAYKPGEVATITIDVVNTGPGSVSGVTVHAVLPQGWHYRSTSSPFIAPGSTRTQPLDAAVNSETPIWGVWTLAPPGAAGANQKTFVEVTFYADVAGNPGNVSVGAFAAGDTNAGQTNAKALDLSVTAAPALSATVSVSPNHVRRVGDSVAYQVRINNTGTGQATGVSMLLTLPTTVAFSSSILPFAGTASRSNGVDPIRNSIEVYYDGFTLGPNSNAGPAYVVVAFKASLLATTPTGTFTVDCQVVDNEGDVITQHAVAPITVG